jgi:S-adenosylmethionine:tRNA ribosyltransferase-isomerase
MEGGLGYDVFREASYHTRMADADLYDYQLPAELIAQESLADRAAARLLVVDRATGGLTHLHVRDLPDILRPGDLVVVNDSRVVPARLVGRRDGCGVGALRGPRVRAHRVV